MYVKDYQQVKKRKKNSTSIKLLFAEEFKKHVFDFQSAN